MGQQLEELASASADPVVNLRIGGQPNVHSFTLWACKLSTGSRASNR